MVTLASNLSYLPFMPLALLSCGNGLGLTPGYDQDDRLTTIRADDGGTHQVQLCSTGWPERLAVLLAAAYRATSAHGSMPGAADA